MINLMHFNEIYVWRVSDLETGGHGKLKLRKIQRQGLDLTDIIFTLSLFLLFPRVTLTYRIHEQRVIYKDAF